jgi:purine-binding chemotaxis protein CheW
MGRMSDARKRARKKGDEPAAEAAVERPPEERRKAVKAPAVEGERTGRLELPPSGLAEDILAMADAAAVSPAPVFEPTPTAMQPSEVQPAGRAHSVSFFAAPVREERKAAEAIEHLATFFLSREEYGVDVRLVQEIIRVTEITPVPRAPESVRGVINLRGRIIPVVDLKRKLGLGDVEAGRRARIVVVKLKERLIGLLVDAASQVLKVPVSAIDPAPDAVVEIDIHYIRGVAKLPERLIILMDLQAVLSGELREGGAA